MMHSGINLDTMFVSLITTTLYASMTTFVKSVFDFIYNLIEKLFVIEIAFSGYPINDIILEKEKSVAEVNKAFFNNKYDFEIDSKNNLLIKNGRDITNTSNTSNTSVNSQQSPNVTENFGYNVIKSDKEQLYANIIRKNVRHTHVKIWRWDFSKFVRIYKYLMTQKNAVEIKEDVTAYNDDTINNVFCPEASAKLLCPQLQKEYIELKKYFKRSQNKLTIGNGSVKRYFIYGPPGGGKTHFASLVAGLSGGILNSLNLQKTLMDIHKKNNTNNNNMMFNGNPYNDLSLINLKIGGTFLFDNIDANDLLFKNDKKKSEYGNMATLCDLLEGKYTPNAKAIIMIANVPEDIPPEVRLRMRRGRVDKIIYVPNIATKEQCTEFIKLYDASYINDVDKEYMLDDMQIDKVTTRMTEESLTVAEVNEICRTCSRTPIDNWFAAIENEKEQRKFTLMNFDDVKSEIKSNNSENEIENKEVVEEEKHVDDAMHKMYDVEVLNRMQKALTYNDACHIGNLTDLQALKSI
uniref:AAA+ ATPase domain-containing protein n=1 Tax=viral metagenome TaxID=1070528 RepID=A0A6C0EDS3_9ZZZZ